MVSPLVPIALTGAALYLLSSGKKRGSRESYGISGGSIPESFGNAGSSPTPSSSWHDRQIALTAISQIRFNVTGGSLRLCAKCDPMGITGNPGPDTRSAIKAFQAITGLDVDGDWGVEEDMAMDAIRVSYEQGIPIPCDPLIALPSPFGCFLDNDRYGLLPTVEARGTAEPPTTYTPDDLLVADAECNHIVHHDDRWFEVQKRRIIAYALDGATDLDSAREIHESMLADYIPLCLSLGRSGVGPGVGKFWDANLAHVANDLRRYDLLPETVEEDALRYGLL